MQLPYSLDRLALYEERLASFQDRLVATVGSHTARVLLDRAIWQAAQCHPALDLIHHDDSGLSFEALEKSCATRPEEEIAVAFNDLVTEMLLILSRLLGRDIAERICADAHL
jgi:hypothetical protein